MAELIIYDSTTWMDDLNPGQIKKHRAPDPARWDLAFSSRWQKGHVVEIREDGGFGVAIPYEHNDTFRIVKIPGVPAAQVEYVMQQDGNIRRRYRVINGEGQKVTVINILDLVLTT